MNHMHNLISNNKNTAGKGVDVFSPYVAFPVLFITGYILSLLRLSPLIGQFSAYVNFYFLASISIYLFACFIVLSVARNITFPSLTTGPVRLNVHHYVIYSISVSFLAFEYYSFGSIPIMTSAFELKRTRFMTNGYIHLIAMSTIPVSIIFLVDLLENFSIKNLKEKIFSSVLLSIPLLMIVGIGNRGQILMVFSVLCIYFHYRINRLRILQITILGSFAFVFLSLTKYLRDYLFYGPQYLKVLDRFWTDALPLWLSPGYLTLTMNYNIFARIVNTFSEGFGVTKGRFTLNPLTSLLPGPQGGVGSFLNRTWNTGFHGNLTSTYLGVPYLDFGVVGVMTVPFILGIILSCMYLRIKRDPSCSNVIIFSFLTFNMMLSIYSYPIGHFHFFWNLALLYFLGIKATPREAGQPDHA